MLPMVKGGKHQVPFQWNSVVTSFFVAVETQTTCKPKSEKAIQCKISKCVIIFQATQHAKINAAG